MTQVLKLAVSPTSSSSYIFNGPHHHNHRPFSYSSSSQIHPVQEDTASSTSRIAAAATTNKHSDRKGGLNHHKSQRPTLLSSSALLTEIPDSHTESISASDITTNTCPSPPPVPDVSLLSSKILSSLHPDELLPSSSSSSSSTSRSSSSSYDVDEEKSDCDPVSASTYIPVPRSKVMKPKGYQSVHADPNLYIPHKKVDGPMTHIIGNWLYLGARSNAADFSELSRHGITHIINVSHESPNFYPKSITYLNIPVEDRDYANLYTYFDKSNNFLDHVKQSNGVCLVHCVAGISRSTTLILAYLISREHMSLTQAFDFIQSKRTRVFPNDGFCRQLGEYEEVLTTKNTYARMRPTLIRQEMIMIEAAKRRKMEMMKEKEEEKEKENENNSVKDRIQQQHVEVQVVDDKASTTTTPRAQEDADNNNSSSNTTIHHHQQNNNNNNNNNIMKETMMMKKKKDREQCIADDICSIM